MENCNWIPRTLVKFWAWQLMFVIPTLGEAETGESLVIADQSSHSVNSRSINEVVSDPRDTQPLAYRLALMGLCTHTYISHTKEK